MENRKLGFLLVIIALLVGAVFIYYGSKLAEQSQELGCFDNKDCLALEKGLSISHFAIGVFSFIFALGFYLIFFNKTDEKIMKKLEEDKEESKFDFAMKLLDPIDARVLRKIREQDGITQSTLRVKLDISKAKLSYVLQDLEKRGLIKRVKKGKTLSVYSKL